MVSTHWYPFIWNSMQNKLQMPCYIFYYPWCTGECELGILELLLYSTVLHKKYVTKLLVVCLIHNIGTLLPRNLLHTDTQNYINTIKHKKNVCKKMVRGSQSISKGSVAINIFSAGTWICQFIRFFDDDGNIRTMQWKHKQVRVKLVTSKSVN